MKHLRTIAQMHAMRGAWNLFLLGWATGFRLRGRVGCRFVLRRRLLLHCGLGRRHSRR